MFVDVQSRNISYDFEGFDEDNTSLTNLNQKLNFLNPKIGINFDNNDKELIYILEKLKKSLAEMTMLTVNTTNTQKVKNFTMLNLGMKLKFCFEDFY